MVGKNEESTVYWKKNLGVHVRYVHKSLLSATDHCSSACRWGFFFFGIAKMSLLLQMKLHEYSVPDGQALAYVPTM